MVVGGSTTRRSPGIPHRHRRDINPPARRSPQSCSLTSKDDCTTARRRVCRTTTCKRLKASRRMPASAPAARRQQPAEAVITPDIAADPKWQALKQLPLETRLARPPGVCRLRRRTSGVLGTFGTYFREKREPTKLERQTVEILAKTAALAIERKRAEEELNSSEERLRTIFEASRDGILVEDDERIIYVNHSYTQLLRLRNP